MYAIFQDGGKQYRAEKGATVALERKTAKGGPVEFTQVVLLHDGTSVKIGTPTVANAKVVGEIVKEVKGPKIRSYKFRRREGYHRLIGHRQKHALVKITEIVVG